jgi:replicative DNA helicase Mcm
LITPEDFGSFFEKHPVIGTPKTLVVEFKDLIEWNPDIAQQILDEPDDLLESFCQAGKFPISIKGLPSEVKLREMGSKHIGKLIELHGIVSRVVPIRPLITLAAFECKKCNEILTIPQDEAWMVVPYTCGKSTDKGKCRGKRFRFIEAESTFIDVQELTIQERPEDLPAGQLPRQVNLEITREDLVNGARAGDIINVVGILRTKASSPTSKKRVFAMHLEVNYLEILNKEISEMKISPDEEQEIHQLAMRPDIYSLIVQSIAPSIYGNLYIKEAIMYLLFGGIRKKKRDIQIRGEMNVLLVGDPATAKSQILQVTANISPRAIYTSGRGTSAAGLTAAVTKVEGEVWALEAGALVLADKGVCCIDEIDKMNDNDRVAIHEAMEQHTVSINKAGINARLNARAAILAAANPDFGRYDRYKTVVENIKKLPITLLSRFDLIFIMKDRLDSDEDEELSAHILGINKKDTELIDSELLKKYIAYARNLSPKLTDEAMKRLQEFYLEMRKAGGENGNESPVAITARQLESLIRISEAHAKIPLKTEVTIEDAEAAINIMKKSLGEVGINPEDKKLDIDILMTGIPKASRDKMEIILNIIVRKGECSIDEINEELKLPREDISKLMNILLSDGKVYSHSEGKYRKV